MKTTYQSQNPNGIPARRGGQPAATDLSRETIQQFFQP